MPYNISQYGTKEFWFSYKNLIKSMSRIYSQRYSVQAKQLVKAGFFENNFGKDLVRYELEKVSKQEFFVTVAKNEIGFGCDSYFIYQGTTKIKWLKKFFAETETFLLANNVIIKNRQEAHDEKEEQRMTLFFTLLDQEAVRYKSQAEEFLANRYLEREINGHLLVYSIRDRAFSCDVNQISVGGESWTIQLPIPRTRQKRIERLAGLFANSESGVMI